MENSAKALEIAAVILVTVTILTLAAYLFISTGVASSKFYQRFEEKEISEFNAQFLKYQGSKTCTLHDVMTVTNLARDNNDRYDFNGSNNREGSLYVGVHIIYKDGGTTKSYKLTDPNISDDQLMDFLKEYSTTTNDDNETVQRKFKCSVQISGTKRVDNIWFEEVESDEK